MSGWHKEPATDRQRAYAESLGVHLPSGATKGRASEMISSALERRGDRGSTTIVLDGRRPLGQRMIDGVALVVAIVGWSVAAVLALIAISLSASGTYLGAGIVAALALGSGLLGHRWRRCRTHPAWDGLTHVPEKVHAKPDTFDASYFTNPKTGKFQFPNYKHDRRFLVEITDHTDYQDMRQAMEPAEWRDYTLEDFEAEVFPEVEVEPFSQLFYKSSTEHLAPLAYLKGQWALVQNLAERDEGEWLVLDPDSKPMKRLLEDGYLFSWQPTTMQDRRAYFEAFKADQLRQACKAAGVKAGQRKAETIDRMIEADREFDLPPVVVPSPRFHEWFDGLVQTYIEHLRANAERFHPLYHAEIWEMALDEAELAPVERAVRQVFESRYWLDRLH